MRRLNVLILIVIGFFQYSSACSCARLKPLTYQEYNEMGSIFLGQVIEKIKDSLTREVYFKFKVKQQYKGLNQEGYFVAKQIDGSCGYNGKIGNWYLIFIDNSLKQPEVHYCTRQYWIENIDTYTSPDWLQYFISKPDGMDTVRYGNGNLRVTGQLLDGLPEGRWKFYDWNGELEKSINYKNGFKHGMEFTLYKGDTIRFQSFRQGVYHGPSKDLYLNGDTFIYSYENWYNDARHGYSKQIDEYGNLISEDYYVFDWIERAIEYYPNGKIKKMRNSNMAINGNYHSSGKYNPYSNSPTAYNTILWYENGNVAFTKKQIEDKTLITRYFPNGNPKIQQLFKFERCSIKPPVEQIIHLFSSIGDTLVYRGEGYFNYQNYAGYIKDSLKEGEWCNVIASGNYSVANYVKGKLHGMQQEFDSNGILRKESYFNKNERIGSWKEYHPNGQL